MKDKLRIGLLLDGYINPAWVFEMVKEISTSQSCEISLVVRKERKIPEKKAPFFIRLRNALKTVLYELYLKVEERYVHVSPNAFENKDISPFVNCPEIVVCPRETLFSDVFSDADIQKIEPHKIDVFIRLGFRILRGDILKTSNFGVWSFHHGDNNVNRGGPAGVWEVIEGWDETGVILQILTEDLDGGVKLFESYASTDKSSFIRNRNNYFWKAKSFIPRKLNELYHLGEKDFFKNVEKENENPCFYYNRLFTGPSNTTMVKYILRRIATSFMSRVDELLFFHQWILLFKLESSEKISKSFFRFKRIVPPKDRFWADPFVMAKDNKFFVFFEEFVYKENKGTIAALEIDEKGNVGKAKPVLERDYHLSYPFLISKGESLYMIPETLENNAVELYRCKKFPYEWEYVKPLIDNVRAVDATILEYNGMYWLFTNIESHPGTTSWDELCLFYTDDFLNGKWMPHPKNPIVSDVKKARPAGKIFLHKGKMYRPSQNCSKHYGYGLNISEITKLSTQEYEEKKLQGVFPNWAKDLKSIHTLNHVGRLTIIDAQIRRKKIG